MNRPDKSTWLQRRGAQLRARLPDRWDATGGAGAALVALGVGMIYRPAGVITAGLACVVIAVLGARAAEEKAS